MKAYIAERVLQTAEFVLQNKCTVRTACKHFFVSKSTAHKDLTQRLRQLDYKLYAQVAKVLADNDSQKHLRGGQATKRKFTRK